MGTVRNARVNQGGPKCAGIVGLGLIGGSFARGYAQAGVRVLAWDPDDDVMTAASMGTVAGELNDETLGECDIIVLACYPEACIEWLEAHARALADATDTEAIMGPVVIDTVGVKGIVCERGIRTFETRTRNTFDLNAVPVLHHLSHLPVVADPSHATGYTRYVEPMALAATACGANGLEIEVHDDPSHAWSDGAQALTPDQFDDTMRRIRAIREVVCQETVQE